MSSTTESEQQKKGDMLTLRTIDNEEFQIEESIATQCVTIKNMIEDGCASNVIPLPTISSKTLVKVIEYLKAHADSSSSKEDLKDFDKEFLNLEGSDDVKELLCDLVLAANFLNISSLLDICNEKFADTIKNMSVEEVREFFKIKNDFTPEEEENIRSENAWAFE